MLARRLLQAAVLISMGTAAGLSRAEKVVEKSYTLSLIRVSLPPREAKQRAFVNRMLRKYRRFDLDRELANLIYEEAREQGIDPTLAFQVIRVESEFFPRAVSYAGARGLAQVMPSTARVIEPGIRTRDLFNPEINLRLGFVHLRDLLRYYGGNVRLALTAYNRGPANVDRDLKAGRDPLNGYDEKVIGP